MYNVAHKLKFYVVDVQVDKDTSHKYLARLHIAVVLLFAQQFVEEGGVDGCPQGAIKHLLNLTNSLNLCLLPLGVG